MSSDNKKKVKPIITKPKVSPAASPRAKLFFRGSRSPPRSASKDDEKTPDLNVAFEKYERIMNTFMKTPPESPKNQEYDDDNNSDNDNKEKKSENLGKNEVTDNVDENYDVEEYKDDEQEQLYESQTLNNILQPDNTDLSEQQTIQVSDFFDITDTKEEGFCSHENITKDKNMTTICMDCGTELYQEISHEQDWRYYGDQDTRNSSDPSRCQFRKSSEKGIKKDLEKMQFPPEICELADQLYLEITKGEVKRNLLRKGIMFACVYEAFKIKKKTKTPDEIQKKFGIDNKSMSQGISYYRLRCPREYFQYEEVDAKHFIPEILKKFNTKDDHVSKVISLYEKIKDACVSLHRSNPKSVSKALVYYYLRAKGCNIDPTKYGKIVSLSEAITIRLSSEINKVLGTTKNVNLF
jgi:transcription initiation factor TFIIIB Brf1 subunit/transcription initiation factor TFIIB